MILASQMYTKLFRPWDVADGQEKCEYQESYHRDTKDEPVSYSPIFKKNENLTSLESPSANSEAKKIELKPKKTHAEKSNKLRKIRNQYKYFNALHQDSTISTTTDDGSTVEDSKTSTASLNKHLDNIDEINKRLGHDEENKHFKNSPKFNQTNKKVDAIRSSKNESTMSLSFPVHPQINSAYSDHVTNQMEIFPYPADPYSQHLPRFPTDLISQAELAQSLGIPPSDPLLLESFAQGYAMELEYARILHEENQAKLLNSRKQRPKKYKCPHCDVGFSNNGQLKGHIRIHTGERPFKCDDKTCGKTFTRNEELTRHRRIHSGLRPYPCQTCGKKFGRRDHLKKHTKTHLVQAERMMPMFVPLTALPPVQGYPYLYGY